MSTGELDQWLKAELKKRLLQRTWSEQSAPTEEFTGFETIRHIVFDVNKADLVDDPDLIHKRLAEEMRNFPSEEFDQVSVTLDDTYRLDYNEIRVYMEAKRIGPGPTVEAMEEVPPM